MPQGEGPPTLMGRLVKGGSINLMNELSTLLFSTIFTILVARNWGSSSFGLYSLVILLTTAVSSLCLFGFDAALVRFIPITLAGKSDAQKLSLQVLLLTILPGLASGALFFALREQLAAYIFHKPELATWLPLLFLLIPSAIAMNIMRSSLVGMQKFGKLFISNFISYLFATAVLLAALSAKLDLSLALMAYLSWLLLSALLMTRYVGIPTKLSSSSVSNTFMLRRMFDFCKWHYGWQIFSIFYYSIDSLIIASFLMLEELAYYRVALFAPKIIILLSRAAQNTLNPYFSELSSNHRELSVALGEGYRPIVPLMTLASSLIFLAGATLIVPVFGVPYQASLGPLRLLIPAYFIQGIQTVAVSYTFAKERLDISFKVGLLTSILILLLSLYLVPMYGIMGGAYAIFIGYLFDFSLLVYLFHTSLGVDLIKMMGAREAVLSILFIAILLISYSLSILVSAMLLVVYMILRRRIFMDLLRLLIKPQEAQFGIH